MTKSPFSVAKRCVNFNWNEMKWSRGIQTQERGFEINLHVYFSSVNSPESYAHIMICHCRCSQFYDVRSSIDDFISPKWTIELIVETSKMTHHIVKETKNNEKKHCILLISVKPEAYTICEWFNHYATYYN